jgi:hypothetical protein
MNNYWHRNREGLGSNILAAVLCAAVVAVFGFGYDHVPKSIWWRGGYWTVVVVVGAAAFLLLFVPRSQSRAPLAPVTEEDRFPLTKEAQHILQVTEKDKYVTFFGTVSFGQKGTRYNAGNVIICNGHDARESARYDSAVKELLNADYIKASGKEVFKLTANGIDRATKLPPLSELL